LDGGQEHAIVKRETVQLATDCEELIEGRLIEVVGDIDGLQVIHHRNALPRRPIDLLLSVEEVRMD
ncbi:hypothetical protein PENTCL1PPCAC_25044, partial [Pristionchus entomophagus]